MRERKKRKKPKSDIKFINKKITKKIDEFIDRNRKYLKKDFPHYPDSYIENLVQRDCMYLFKLKEYINKELVNEQRTIQTTTE